MPAPSIKTVRKFLNAVIDGASSNHGWCEKSYEEICSGLGYSQDEYNAMLDFCRPRGLIEVTGKSETFTRVRAGQQCADWLRENRSAWTLERWGVILGVLAAIAAAVAAWIVR